MKNGIANALAQCLIAGLAVGSAAAQIAQQNPVPLVNVGGTYMESQFARLDFAQKILEEQNHKNEEQRRQQQKLVDSGTVSVWDLQAPARAVSEFNTGAELLQRQKSKEAVAHFTKAIAAYPKFISALNDLGLAYEDLDQVEDARREFDLATKLDAKFAGSYVNLGRLDLAQKNFGEAVSILKKAALLRPLDASVLTVLTYAENSAHEYRHAIDTAQRVHGLQHKGFANVHYVAASSAIEVKDFDAVRRELERFLKEDPANPLAPAAKYNLKLLASYKPDAEAHSSTSSGQISSKSTQRTIIYSDPEALQKALAGLDDSDDKACADCVAGDHELAASLEPNTARAPRSTSSVSVSGASGYKIRQVVDEVAVFFSVMQGGKLISDLQREQLTVRDDGKAPISISEFAPQSKLPLHVGLLIDTSGSLQQRFDFEKQAAARFISRMLRNSSDLAFVGGFANDTAVTQDFTADAGLLAAGIEKLQISGGTAIWDAVSRACWKLAAYPEKERVANVLVVLTDGEDNASRTSLRQAVHDAENTGVTVYVISTRDYQDLHQFGKTDADKVLQELSNRTGGEAMFPGEMRALDKTFERLGDVIRSRYFVAYKPAAFQANGRYRKIALLATRNGVRLKVHARQGYYAPLEKQ